ncbi:hypothetical protein HBA95_17015 [Ochrobactrum sp. MR31]|nr:hypothetical protein [Ochrobactrum sp. MR31]
MQAGKSLAAQSCNGAAEGQSDLYEINADNQRGGDRDRLPALAAVSARWQARTRKVRFTIKLTLGPR